MSSLDWSILIAAVGLLITSVAHAVPRVVPAVIDAARAWRSRSHATEVTAETVRGIVDAMRASLEVRITQLVADNSALRDRVGYLEGVIKRYEGLLAAAEKEHEALRAAIAGERRVALAPPPIPGASGIGRRGIKEG